MLDNVLNSVRRGMERARVRGEEAYQATRLRLEIFNLGREQDTLFGRLGRAYHGGSDVAVLAQIQSEIRRVAEEIRSRELLIEELGRAPENQEGVSMTPQPVQRPAVTPLQAAGTPPDPETTPAPPEDPATDPAKVTPDPAEDAIDTADNEAMEAGLYKDRSSPDVPLTPLRREDSETLQREEIHKNSLREGELATEHPDPLDK